MVKRDWKIQFDFARQFGGQTAAKNSMQYYRPSAFWSRLTRVLIQNMYFWYRRNSPIKFRYLRKTNRAWPMRIIVKRRESFQVVCCFTNTVCCECSSWTNFRGMVKFCYECRKVCRRNYILIIYYKLFII